MAVESDVRYYSRRACEEMAAANRAVTAAARDRRLQLVDMFVQRLAELKAPSPFSERQFPRSTADRSAFNFAQSARN
jgi:hypothetical protein